MRIRDPIHGTIPVSDQEKAIIDSRFFQRLRNVRQLGFGDLAFPGATHTRHAHSMGAMHVASRLFDAVAARSDLPEPVQARFRATVRAAVLCHDLGHMPLSHASEKIAPPRRALKLPTWISEGPEAPGPDDQASHEDFTVKIVLDSSLRSILEREYGDLGITPEAIASLISGAPVPGGSPFVHEGIDWFPLLRATVSGELDADRMDYLLRDSFFTGVTYGRYDLEWIVQNLNPAVIAGRAHLALSRAAAFAFEDFLLSRYHMFLSVYYHHTTVNFDHMLRRFYEEAPGEFEIPSDPEAFLVCDDVALITALRASKNRWAARIVSRSPFKRVVEFTERDVGYDLKEMDRILTERGIEHFTVESRGVLSRYFDDGHGPSLYILDVSSGRLTEVAKYTPLYDRMRDEVRITRIFARPDQADAARAALKVPSRPVEARS
ncbi:MAG: HD domain-containing protein [Myxococcaceae bacterium]|nr:HD domain-containing protein [Myxococcaceae bacterium]